MKIRDVVDRRRKAAKVRANREQKARVIASRRWTLRAAAIKRATWDRIVTDAHGQKWIAGPDPIPLI